ncbi:MAG: prepilin-type N-terminal cleavage/methylation domain-containing protein [Candidatus Omnitrophica bacterium]|nr:prepilin-type N-terminal cleavage/methylation domain-containing protein [Candidatus Omnitrophota bacterium]
MPRDQRGMTFIELMVASVISAAVAGGTLATMITAARLSTGKVSPDVGEAVALGQETIERPRNHVAADDLGWFASRTGSWQDDDVALPPPTSSESILQPPGAERRRCITPVDDDLDGRTDYYKVQVVVCWDGTTACPGVGTACS